MGILEVITVVLFVLKLTLYPEWSWWLVASPILAALVLYLVIFIPIFLRGSSLLSRKHKK